MSNDTKVSVPFSLENVTIYQAKMPKIIWCQLIKCEDLQFLGWKLFVGQNKKTKDNTLGSGN